MKQKQLQVFFILLCCAIVCLTGCGKGKTNRAEQRTITDMMGRQVSLEKIPDRIVVLTPSDCEILYALGVGDKIVGRGTYCDYPQEAKQIKEVASGEKTNVEQIIALQPDVVFMETMAQSIEPIEKLEKAGIPVIETDAKKIEEVYDAITLLGKAVGKQEEALQLTNEMQQSFEEIQKKVADQGHKKVYFEVSPLEYGLWTAGKNTFLDELATLLGLTNIFSDIEGFSKISQEQVLKRNPDYIITMTMGEKDKISPEEEISQRKGWETITAVKNKQIFRANNDEVSRPGPRLVKAAQELYAFVYEK